MKIFLKKKILTNPLSQKRFFKKLTAQENKKIRQYLNDLLHTPEAELMKRCIQHGQISTYSHIVSVVRLSFYINRRLNLHASERELVRGAFLHDFYLYDWHENGYIGRLHGLHHPAIALKNASSRYHLTPVECNIIISHMWPLTLFQIPKCREAFIVCLADKVCSSYEVLVKTKSLSC